MNVRETARTDGGQDAGTGDRAPGAQVVTFQSRRRRSPRGRVDLSIAFANDNHDDNDGGRPGGDAGDGAPRLRLVDGAGVRR